MKQAVFFDLDGTLLDTARDFAFAINLMLAQQQKPALNFDLFRKTVYGESKKMISFAFNMDESHPDFENLRNTFLKIYHANCTQKTIFFPGIEQLLNTLDANYIPWGIITSKPTWLAKPVTHHFNLDKRAACIVMGDTLNKVKPDPAPLFHACQHIAVLPENAIYVGDLHTDILAAKAANMKSVCVTYGYHPSQTDFSTWQADFIAHLPSDIAQWMKLKKA